MVRTLTKYISEAGEEFGTLEEAEAHDQYHRIKSVLEELLPELNGFARTHLVKNASTIYAALKSVLEPPQPEPVPAHLMFEAIEHINALLLHTSRIEDFALEMMAQGDRPAGYILQAPDTAMRILNARHFVQQLAVHGIASQVAGDPPRDVCSCPTSYPYHDNQCPVHGHLSPEVAQDDRVKLQGAGLAPIHVGVDLAAPGGDWSAEFVRKPSATEERLNAIAKGREQHKADLAEIVQRREENKDVDKDEC